MPNEVDKYLGPHRKIGPGSYELAPYPIVGKWESEIKFGGGYNTWGLNEGSRRGEGGPSNIREVAKPNVVAELMNNKSIIRRPLITTMVRDSIVSWVILLGSCKKKNCWPAVLRLWGLRSQR